MIGNDVVDLLDSDVRLSERTASFDARVFTAGERERIAAGPEGVRARWLMWAAKEAAYKLARKRDGRIRFVPRRFEVSPWTPIDAPGISGGEADLRLGGRVCVEDFSVDCDWISGQGFVHALCRPPGTPLPQCMAVERIRALAKPAGDPGEAVRRLALGKIARFLGADEDALRIEKRGRIPVLCFGDREAAADLSLSHHGSVVAFACLFSSGLDSGDFRARAAGVPVGSVCSPSEGAQP